MGFYFDEAIRLDPKNSMAWKNKGNVLMMQDKYDEAEQVFTKAILLDPLSFGLEL